MNVKRLFLTFKILTIAFLKQVWADFVKFSGLEPTMLDKMKVTKALPGVVHLSLPLEQKHLV